MQLRCACNLPSYQHKKSLIILCTHFRSTCLQEHVLIHGQSTVALSVIIHALVCTQSIMIIVDTSMCMSNCNKELDHCNVLNGLEHKWGGASQSTRLRLKLYELHPTYGLSNTIRGHVLQLGFLHIHAVPQVHGAQL